MTVHYTDESVTLHHGDALDVLRALPDESVHCVVTSPPYFNLRDYGVPGQLGAEESPAQYVAALVAVFDELRRVLRKDGTCWLNLGDSYAGSWGAQGKVTQGFQGRLIESDVYGGKTSGTGSIRPGMPAAKNLIGMPWRVALALQDAGWILRNDIVWAKPNAMPESIKDRMSSRHEHLFLLTRSPRYHFDIDPIRVQYEGDRAPDRRARTPAAHWKANSAPAVWSGEHTGRNPGDVWTIPTSPFPGAHFAVMPPEIPRRAILSGCPEGGTVLDPFHGSGTTGMVAQQHGRRYIGIDLNREYLDLSLRTRLAAATLPFEGAS